MADTRDVQAVVTAAEAAAAAGDYVAAEARLREAAGLQEAQLGPLHPDLANTLNNLGIVNEILEKPAEAEASFRRAVAIATTSLAPDHPFVLTSRKNLADFCAARGIAVELPRAAAGVAAKPETRVAEPGRSPAPAEPRTRDRTEPRTQDLRTQDGRTPSPSEAKKKPGPAPAPAPAPAQALKPPSPPRSDSPKEPAPPPPPIGAAAAAPETGSHRRSALAIGALLIAVLVLLILAMRNCPTTGTGTPAGDASPSSARSPAPPASSAASSSPGTTPPPAPAPSTTTAPSTPTPPTPAPFPTARESAPTERGVTPTIVSARVCRDLATSRGWQCTDLTDAVTPGLVFFYTRLTTPRSTTVEHRWYRGTVLVQSVELSIGANTSEGYRTYSRQTVDSRAATWRVELRSASGELLHEQSFSVK